MDGGPRCQVLPLLLSVQRQEGEALVGGDLAGRA
jgi:hypothetical protein